MLSPNINDAFNKQLNLEIYSAYIYLSMAARCNELNLSGFANWLQVQAQEELAHTMRFYDYIFERGGSVVYEALAKPPSGWDSVLAIFETGYHHEGEVTARINTLMDLALEESDHASSSFLQWFIDEQVEEEATFLTIVQQLKLIQESPQALFMLDKEMGQRVFTPPAQ